MATPVKNLFIDQGSSFSYSLTANIPVGCTTVNGQLRRSYYSSSYVNFTCSLTAGTGGTGSVTISLGATTSAALKPGRYVWDLEASYGLTTTRLRQGTAYVDPEVTK
jgi:hypothetical protein